MSQVSTATTKRLFAVSGNHCAFPKCPLELVDRLSGKVTGRICHIRAAREGGPRYDPDQTDTERHGYANLVLLCPIHHDVVDSDETSYTIDRLLKLKADHESRFTGAPSFDVDDTLANEVIRISNETTIAGSVLMITNPTGGQFAHTITNNTVAPLPPPSWRDKIHERAAEAMLDLWNLFHEAYGALIDLTSPLQRYPDLNRMSTVQFDEWLASAELPKFREDEVRNSTDRTKRYSEIRVWSQLSRAQSTHTAFNNALVKAQPLLPALVKTALNAVSQTMREALLQMGIGLEANEFRMRAEAGRLAFSIQNEVPKLEELIHDQVYGRTS